MASSVPGLGPIAAPYGFKEIVPVAKNHRVLLPKNREVAEVFRSLTVIPVSYGEIPSASRDYPLIFITNDKGKTYSPMAVTGLNAQHNLFVRADGTWDPMAYVPAYVRRHPFCMMRIMNNGQERPERIACVEKMAIDSRGDALYDDGGNPAPDWEARQNLLFEFEADLLRTDDMCRTLTSLGLFEPFTAQVTPTGGNMMQLTGMHRIAELKLATLGADTLKELVQKSILGCVYAHLLSLRNFPRLLERQAASASALGTDARLN